MLDNKNVNSKSSTPKKQENKLRERSRSRSKEKHQEEKGKIEKSLEKEEKEAEEKKEEYKIPEAFQRELPNDLILWQKNESDSEPDYILELQVSQERPKINLTYGDNRLVIEEKNKITQFRDIWDSRIKYLISDYELIDIFRPHGKAKYNESIIKYMDYHKTQKSYLSSKHELSEVFSRAYFKLNEVLQISDALKDYKGKGIKIACLAEGPGGFINCLVDYRNQQNEEKIKYQMEKYGSRYRHWTDDKYYSITLRVKKESQYNRALDWEHYKSKKYFGALKYQKYKINLSYGTGDGDMLNTENLNYFIEKDLGNAKCELVTADGGIELTTDEEYEYQELYNVKLFFSEAITAMACQALGGKYIMKIYDSFFDTTIDILTLLTIYYERVRITKPHTSRPASSERYLVCENFKGISKEKLKELFDLLEKWVNIEKNMDYLKNESFVMKFLNYKENENAQFKKNLRESNEDCIHFQIDKIKEGLKIIEDKKENDMKERKLLQKQKAIAWCKLYKIPFHHNLDID